MVPPSRFCWEVALCLCVLQVFIFVMVCLVVGYLMSSGCFAAVSLANAWSLLLKHLLSHWRMPCRRFYGSLPADALPLLLRWLSDLFRRMLCRHGYVASPVDALPLCLVDALPPLWILVLNWQAWRGCLVQSTLVRLPWCCEDVVECHGLGFGRL